MKQTSKKKHLEWSRITYKMSTKYILLLVYLVLFNSNQPTTLNFKSHRCWDQATRLATPSSHRFRLNPRRLSLMFLLGNALRTYIWRKIYSYFRRILKEGCEIISKVTLQICWYFEVFCVERCGNPIHEPAIFFKFSRSNMVFVQKAENFHHLTFFQPAILTGLRHPLSYTHTTISGHQCRSNCALCKTLVSPSWLPQPPENESDFLHKLLLKGPGSRGYSPIYDPMLAFVPLSCSAYMIAGVCWKHLRWCKFGCLDPPGTGPATTMLGYSWCGQHAHLSWQGYYD